VILLPKFYIFRPIRATSKIPDNGVRIHPQIKKDFAIENELSPISQQADRKTLLQRE